MLSTEVLAPRHEGPLLTRTDTAARLAVEIALDNLCPLIGHHAATCVRVFYLGAFLLGAAQPAVVAPVEIDLHFTAPAIFGSLTAAI